MKKTVVKKRAASKTASKKTAVKTAPAAPLPPTVALFVVFIVGSGTPLKTQVASVEIGKDLIDKAHKAIKDNTPFYDKERGILIKEYELNMVYLSAEQVVA